MVGHLLDRSARTLHGDDAEPAAPGAPPAAAAAAAAAPAAAAPQLRVVKSVAPPLYSLRPRLRAIYQLLPSASVEPTQLLPTAFDLPAFQELVLVATHMVDA